MTWADPLLPRAGSETTITVPPLIELTFEPEPAEMVNFAATKWRNRRFHRRHPVLAAVCVVVAVLLLPVLWSYGRALTAPGQEGFAARTAEWMRDHEMGGAVNWLERRWYDMNEPKIGGAPDSIVLPVIAPALTSPPITAVASTAAVTATTVGAPSTSSAPATTTTPAPHLAAPASLVTPAASPVAGEGVWVPFAIQADGVAAGYLTQIRPDAVHTSELVLVAWMDPHRATFQQFPGTKVPGGSWATPPQVPVAAQRSLIAAFNGGFRLEDARGGYYAEGRYAKPLRDGAASLVIGTTGQANVVMWGRDAQMGPGIATVRQNLDLLIDGGVPAPDLSVGSSPRWGWTLGNEAFVARSGVGVTADGALVFVGGPAMSVQTLADTLQRAGAVRAMELDINEDWISYNIYATNAKGKVEGRKALPAMKLWGGRYLGTDSRDFIGVFQRPLPAD
jgi:hypothetical protein